MNARSFRQWSRTNSEPERNSSPRTTTYLCVSDGFINSISAFETTFHLTRHSPMCIDICGNEHTSVSAAQNPSAPVDYGCCGCADPRVAHKTWIQSAGVIVLILSIVEFGIAGSASTHGRFGAWWVAIFTTFGALLGISMRFRGFAIASVVVSVFTLFASVVGTSVDGSTAGFLSSIAACSNFANVTNINRDLVSTSYVARATSQALYCKAKAMVIYPAMRSDQVCYCSMFTDVISTESCLEPVLIYSGDCRETYGPLASKLSASTTVLGILIAMSFVQLVFASVAACRCCSAEVAPEGQFTVSSGHQIPHGEVASMHQPQPPMQQMLVQLPDGSFALVQPIQYIGNPQQQFAPYYVQQQMVQQQQRQQAFAQPQVYPGYNLPPVYAPTAVDLNSNHVRNDFAASPIPSATVAVLNQRPS